MTTPVPGLGTSVSTLSVEISSSGSSASIVLALGLQPLGDRPLGDGDAHLRHDDVDDRAGGHQYAASSRSPAATVSTCGMKAFSSGGENGTGVSGRGDPLHRRVERLERLLGDRGRDLGAEAAGARVLVQDEHLGRLLDAGEHRLLVPRHHRAQVDTSTETSSLRELLGRLVGGVAPSRPT